MPISVILLEVAVFATGLFWSGYWFGTNQYSQRSYRIGAAVGVLCALPALIIALYYLHWFDGFVWFYQFRSVPFAELSAAGAGFGAGMVHAWLERQCFRLRTLLPGLLLVVLFVPYIKPVVSPLDIEKLHAQCPDGVCLQSTPSTCGPASVASILRLFGYDETEETLARESYTSATGTENWYLARAIRRRGLFVTYVVTNSPVNRLPVNRAEFTGGSNS